MAKKKKGMKRTLKNAALVADQIRGQQAREYEIRAYDPEKEVLKLREYLKKAKTWALEIFAEENDKQGTWIGDEWKPFAGPSASTRQWVDSTLLAFTSDEEIDAGGFNSPGKSSPPGAKKKRGRPKKNKKA